MAEKTREPHPAGRSGAMRAVKVRGGDTVVLPVKATDLRSARAPNAPLLEEVRLRPLVDLALPDGRTYLAESVVVVTPREAAELMAAHPEAFEVLGVA